MGHGPLRSSLEPAVINLKAVMIKVLDDPKSSFSCKIVRFYLCIPWRPDIDFQGGRKVHTANKAF